MEPEYRLVPFAEVDWDDLRFDIPSFVPDAPLEDSVRRYGCLTPPWVLEKEGPAYTVVDGFKRLRFLRDAAQAPGVHCLVYPKGSDFADMALRRVELRCTEVMQNTAEKAVLVRLVGEVEPGGEDLARLLRLMAIPRQPLVLADWIRLGGSRERLLSAAAEGTICPKAALRLASWSLEESDAALDALVPLRCSASIQTEILDRAVEIAAVRESSRLNVLTSEGVRVILDHADLNNREKTEALRRHLFGLLYPRLREREERFSREIAEVALPSGMRLVPPPSFEGERWKIELSFSTEAELDALLDASRDLLASGRLRTLRDRGTSFGEKPVAPDSGRRKP